MRAGLEFALRLNGGILFLGRRTATSSQDAPNNALDNQRFREKFNGEEV